MREEYRVLLLTYGSAPAERMILRLPLPVTAPPQLRADTGFFKIYERAMR